MAGARAGTVTKITIILQVHCTGKPVKQLPKAQIGPIAYHGHAHTVFLGLRWSLYWP